MSSTYKRHQKIVQPYANALTELVKGIPPVCVKLKRYPTFRDVLFPGDEGRRAYQCLPARTRAFDESAKNAFVVANSLLNQADRYLKTLQQEYLVIADYRKLLSDEATELALLLLLVDGVFSDLCRDLYSASDEALLAARSSPSCNAVSSDMFAAFAFELAELRTCLRKMNADVALVQKTYAEGPAHKALCPRCRMATACKDAAHLN